MAYYHFSSKADIATCILVEGIGEIVDDFVAIAGKAPSAVEALTAMMDSFAATIFRNAGFGRILVSELWRRGREWSEPMRALEERLLAVLRGQIERGQREGSIRGDIDAAFEAVAVVGMVLTVPAEQADKALEILHANGEPEAYRLGVIAEGEGVELC